MIRGFKALVKKNNYVHVTYPHARVRRSPSPSKSVPNKKSPRILSPGVARMIQVATASNTNRPGSVLGREPNWHGDRALLNKLVRTSTRIGAQSMHGTVRELVDSSTGITNRWCIKTVKFRTPEKLKWFMNEVRVGTLKNIEAIGTRIYAWRRRLDGAEYVMDNVEMGDPNAKTFTFYQIRKKYGNTFNVAVARALDAFHTVTRGEHGDLHGDNILFVQRGKTFDIRIIDYGTWKSDNNTLGKPYITKMKIPVYRLKNGRMFRENGDMLMSILGG